MQHWNKKEAIIVLGVVFLAMLVSGCATQETAIENAPETVGEDAKQEAIQEPEPLPEPQQAEGTDGETAVKDEPVVAAATEPAAGKFRIFDPILTYEGAYNGPLYGTSEQVGSASMDSYFKLLDKNGINFFIGSDTGLGEIIDAAKKHPYRVIPFFNPGIGGEEVGRYLGESLTGMYKSTLSASQKIAGKGFIRGFGEVETQEWNVRHDDQKVLQLISLAQKNGISFMFHPVAAKIGDVGKIAEAYPDTTFLIHMYREDLDKSRAALITLLKEHDNIYFSMDAAHILFVDSLGGDLVYVYDSENKQSSIDTFVSVFDSREKAMTADAIKAYKPLVDAVPDKVMWGTEIGPEYAFDPRVFDRAVKISRFVIAGFDKEHQEAVGYKNALRVFGEGAVVDASIKVIGTSSWPECTSAQMAGCDTSCEIPDSDTLTAEQEACYQNCMIGKQCREVIEMDVG